MKKARKFLIGTTVAAAGVSAVTAISYKLTKKLLNVAMAREMPKGIYDNKEKLYGSTEIKTFLDELDSSAEKLLGAGCETVEIASHDGLRLVGHWYDCPNAKRIIVAMHGWRSTWARDFSQISDFWHDSGCSVLYAEQRGQGNSDGDYMGFGLLERYDCLDWINWAVEKSEGKLPIYLGGVSMGATTVLMTAGLDLPENVCGIVADCGFTSPHAVWKHVVENNLHLTYNGLRGAVASDLCKKRINIGAKDYSTIDAMQVCSVPVLFIHGTDDRFVPIEMTYENYKHCVAPKDLLVVPGAEHGMSYYLGKELYEAKITEFWQKYDKTS
ncbi:MAG: alpha/beta hydrolase [Clostridia bacterium]|nr:alpha/beta hydrolase [Clostridia bacterium]